MSRPAPTVIRVIGELARTFPRVLAGGTLLLFAEGLIGTVSILSLAPIIDLCIAADLQRASPVTQRAAQLVEAVGLPASLPGFLAVFLILQLLKNAFAIFSKYCVLRAKLAVLHELIVGTFEDLFAARWSFFSASKQGALLNTFLHELAIVGDAFGQVALFFASVIQVACYVTVPLALSWQVTCVSVAAALVFAWPLFLLGKTTYRLGQHTTSAANELGSVLQENLTMAKVILGFGNQRQGIEALDRAFGAHRRSILKARTLTTSTPLLYEPLGMVVLVVTVLVAQRFALPMSELAVLLWALRQAVPLLGGIAAQKNVLLNCFPSYEQIKRLRQHARALKQPSGGRLFTGFQRGLTMEHVTFAYPGHEPVLQDINLLVPYAKMVALVGESGAGKSTLIDLLMGFHEPTAGRVLVDGVPLQEFDICSYRHRIGYVPQESVLFHMSIRDNLRWAKPDATEEDLRQACRQANAEEFIERFPDGYDTLVGDRGVRLSGGQCQRVALARAILRRPDLLILDEATSSLDSQSEQLIQQAIETVAKKTTVIVIAHRLSTIANADEIYVLQRGRIVEQGTCQTLLQQEGHFSRMTQRQLFAAAASAR